MKKIILFLLFISFQVNIFAYDFFVDGFYFNITSSVEPYTLAVTYKSHYANTNEYTGNLTVPSTVTYNGITYSVTSIGDDAFYGCSGLKSINLSTNITYIGTFAFINCTGLTNMEIPNSITNINNFTFKNCSGLVSIKFPNSVKSIGGQSFYSCGSLTNITLPSSITSLGTYAFGNCNINKIILLGSVPPSTSTEPFLSVNKSTCLLVVPAGAKTSYAVHSYWKSFSNIKEFYNVKFDVKGANEIIDPQLIIEGETVVVPTPQPTKTNLTFADWWEDIHYQLKWDFSNFIYNNMTLYAKWIATVSTTVGVNGNITPSGDIEVMEDSVLTITITPDVGYKTKSLIFNGIDLTSQIAENKFSTPIVTQNSTLEVAFESNTFTYNNSNQQDKIKIHSTHKGIEVEGISIGEIISVYDLKGKEIRCIKADKSNTFIHLPKNTVYIVKTLYKTAKVVL